MEGTKAHTPFSDLELRHNTNMESIQHKGLSGGVVFNLTSQGPSQRSISNMEETNGWNKMKR